MFKKKNCWLHGAHRHLSYKLKLENFMQAPKSHSLPLILGKFYHAGVLLFAGNYPNTVLAHGPHLPAVCWTSFPATCVFFSRPWLNLTFSLMPLHIPGSSSPSRVRFTMLCSQNSSFIVTQHLAPCIVTYWFPRSFPWDRPHIHHSIPRAVHNGH